MFLFDKKNDFTFTNTQYRDFLTHTFERADTQKFAAIRNIGLIQEVNYRFNNTSYISSKTWLQKDWHQLQPNMASNLTIKGATVLENHHIRTWTEYVKLFESWDLNIGGGYVRDYQLYNKNLLQVVGTNRFIGKFEVNRGFGRQGDKNKHSIRAGGNVKHISPFVYAYNKATIRYEQHLDLYFLYLYNPFKSLKITANLRQMFVTDFKAPFTPSLGLKFILYNNVSNSLSIQSNVSRFYRVPTFNDRFWGGQGNPGLLPEDGMHYETGLSYFHCTRNWQSEFRVNGFYMLVDNWILWIQQWSEELQRTDWLAENVLQVESKGIELYSSNTIKYGGFRFKFGGGYTYNPVVKKSSLTSSDAINRQLAHVPENTANAWLDVSRKSTSVIFDHAFIGERYEDDSDEKLAGYALFNLALRQAVNIKSHQFKIIGGIQNILNTSYQHQQNYAMPGRSFKISIIYN
jgi:iron complex outermembrane receptor protein